MTNVSTREILQQLANRPIGGPEIMAEAERLLNDPNTKPSAALKEAAHRANKLWLPQGRKAVQAAPKETDLKRLAENHARRAREQKRQAENIAKLLDYYATTQVPVERIAEHIGKTNDLPFVREALRMRGRV